MRQIFASSDLRESDLAALYAYPAGPWLRANMVSSADGAAMLTGLTAGLSWEADRRLFALLRTLADVIVVGAGTVRAEKYKPVRQHELWPDLRPGRTPTPPIAVVTARLDLEPSSPLITLAPASAQPLSLGHVLEDNGFLFCRYIRKDHLFRTDRGICPPAPRRVTL